MAVKPLLIRGIMDHAANRPSPIISFTIAHAEPSFTLFAPTLLLFTLSSDKFRADIEFFANEPIVFDVAHAPSLGCISRVVFKIGNVLEDIILIVKYIKPFHRVCNL